MIKKIQGYFFRNRLRKILTGFFLLGFIYLIAPGPASIDNFPPIPDSLKSQLEGDTIQNPNIAAYYSDYRRDFITKYYYDRYRSMFLFGKIIPPIVLNHRPESAYQYVRDQQESTFLEEYTYPFRETIFVNGYEPLVQNQMNKHITSEAGNHIIVRDKINGTERLYDSKATLRYYPNNTFLRVLIYMGIWLFSIYLYKFFLKAFQE